MLSQCLSAGNEEEQETESGQPVSKQRFEPENSRMYHRFHLFIHVLCKLLHKVVDTEEMKSCNTKLTSTTQTAQTVCDAPTNQCPISAPSNSLLAGWSGDRIPVGASFPTPIQTSPGATQTPTRWVPGYSSGEVAGPWH